MALDYGTIGVDDTVEGLGGEGKDFVGIAIVQVVEEDASESPGLITVGDDKVSVGPGLELGVELKDGGEEGRGEGLARVDRRVRGCGGCT